MLQQVETTIHQHRLIGEGDHILAAVSGGADSVAMLYLLFSLSRTVGYSLGVIHVNHGLRGKESDQDEKFVQALAWSLGLSCIVESVATRKAAREPGVSLEMAARHLRHRAYLDACLREGAAAVAVAHNLEDQAETVLMRLARGSGPRGLGGIRHTNRVGALRLVRPCLDLPRRALRDFLRVHGIRWREDASNQDRKFARNRVRHDVLPPLEKINSAAVAHITQAAALCREDDEALEQMLRPHLTLCIIPDAQGGVQVDAMQYRVLPKALQRRVLMHWLDRIGLDPAEQAIGILLELDSMLHHPSQSRMSLPGGIQVSCSHGWLQCEPKSCEPFSYSIKPGDFVVIPEAGLSIHAEWVDRMDSKPAHKPFLDYPQEACLSLKKKDPDRLEVRCWREGDVLHPLGFKGRKKLQDIFTDAKVPRALRHCIPLVCRGDEVLWIPGYQVARRCKVTKDSKRILHFRVVEAV